MNRTTKPRVEKGPKMSHVKPVFMAAKQFSVGKSIIHIPNAPAFVSWNSSMPALCLNTKCCILFISILGSKPVVCFVTESADIEHQSCIYTVVWHLVKEFCLWQDVDSSPESSKSLTRLAITAAVGGSAQLCRHPVDDQTLSATHFSQPNPDVTNMYFNSRE